MMLMKMILSYPMLIKLMTMEPPDDDDEEDDDKEDEEEDEGDE